MISKDISRHVLTIGTDYKPCSGGISVLLNGYSSFFEEFNFIKSSGPGNKINKLFYFLQSIVLLLLYGLFLSKIKIVHIHTSTFSFLRREKFYVYIASFLKKKVVVHIHGGAFETLCKSNAKDLRSVYRKVDVSVCVSKYIQNIVYQYNIHKNSIVIPNFIDVPKLSGVKEHKLVNMTFLGTVTEYKGIFDVIDVLGQNQAYFRGKVSFKIAGKGKERELLKIIEKYGINDFVHYIGLVKGEEKEFLLNDTDIYVQPSYIESFGISIIEAMSYGASVISCNVGGIPEVVDDSVGYLVKPGDKEELFKKLSLLIENKDLRLKFSDNAQKKCRQYFMSETEVLLEKLYVSLLGK